MRRPGLLVKRRLVAVEPRPSPRRLPARSIDSTSTPAATLQRFRGVLTAGMVGTGTLADGQEPERSGKWRFGRVGRGDTPSNEAWKIAA